MRGLKQVRHRRDDAMARVRWDRLEVLLAEYYARQGYRVEHVGTGGTRQRFDGGIDLKLRKDDEYILVQCKGWNAYQVPHNEVHQLIGLVVNEGATGAILVTSGEFTRAAIEAAARGKHVQLVDGDDLRRMLGPVAEESVEPVSSIGTHGRTDGLYELSAPTAQRIVASVGERLLSAAEDRIRHGSGWKRRGAGRAVAYGLAAKLLFALVSFTAFVLMIVFAMILMKSTIDSAASTSMQAAPNKVAPATPVVKPSAEYRHAAPPLPRKPTEAEIRESQRKADEAMKVIEATTPEV